MSRRNKLQKFAELLTLPNVYESFDAADPKLTGLYGEDIDLKGQWAATHFNNDHPITLELACGRGEYTLALAREYPDRNFIGVDIKGARIYQGAKVAQVEALTNAAFLRTRIERIACFFAPHEISEIWITFPDPFLRKSKSNRRLTAPNFLDHYRRFLRPDGHLHLKTDDDTLYEFTLETLSKRHDVELLEAHSDIYDGPLPIPELRFKTYYEAKHLAAGKTIKYIRFRFLTTEQPL